MLKTFVARLQQRYRTIAFPDRGIKLPERFRGRPVLDRSRCPADCRRCIAACPTGAIQFTGKTFCVDLGKCLFCGDCRAACPHDAIRYASEYSLAARQRAELFLHDNIYQRTRTLDQKMKKLFGRSLKLRQVSAGGCNGCEMDVNVLSTVVFDLGRFGIQFVAAPRHADGLLITGPVTQNMQLALKKTYDALPAPKLVIAVGACAISGGPYMGHLQARDGAAAVVPVDLYIPGCPPHPLTILDGLIHLLGKNEERI